MEFFYSNDISSLVPNCPPNDYMKVEQECYRWVFDTIEHPDNFRAVADRNPKIIKSKNDEKKCEYWALSFHKTLEDSIASFEFLVENVCKNDKEIAYKRYGTNIARGILGYDDGVSSDIDDNGHFNFHHIKHHNFVEKFKIVKAL